MKELSIEEKVKAYDEAIEKAKVYYHLGDDKHKMAIDAKAVMEYIFPALKESEDEMARKYLISFVELNSGFNLPPEDAKKILAWLKKQGEQNYKIIKGKNYFCVKTHNYAGVEWVKGTKYYASDNYTLVNQGCECYCPKYSKEEHNNLFEEVKCDGFIEKTIEQNLAWSEEDEYHRNIILYCLNNESVGKTDKEKAISWLKSLRPQWKPSEKQLYAMMDMIERYRGDYLEEFYTLYQDLKKLTE